jgi:hypothetical protein
MRNWLKSEWAVLITLSLGFFMTLLDMPNPRVKRASLSICDLRSGQTGHTTAPDWGS